MKENPWANTAFCLASASLASFLTAVPASEFGWTKFIAWMIFFAGIQSPFLVSSKHTECVTWLDKKKGKAA